MKTRASGRGAGDAVTPLHRAQLVREAGCTLALCQAHNLKVIGSNPIPATKL
jgi:hypothetical protein